MQNKIILLITTLFVSIILGLSIRGIEGTPTSATVNQETWRDEGPFELSPERGRFALALSIIENRSVEFSDSIARFATPDLGMKNGRYVSLFAPLMSFIIIPGYLVGSLFNAGQFGTYVIVAVFALLNVLLIRTISIKIGAHPIAAVIGAVIFLFASPSFAYAVSLYQHHISLFVFLSAIYLLISNKTWTRLFIVWALIGISLPLDYPNLFMMLPIIAVALKQSISFVKAQEKIKVQIRPLAIVACIGAFLPLLFFFWFNFASYGSPFSLLSSVAQIKEIEGTSITDLSDLDLSTQTNTQTPPLRTSENRSTVGFFQSRLFLNGISILIFSEDRGLIFFTPVMLLGFIGIYLAYKKGNLHLPLLVSVMGFNLVLYAMWGDPWGGWAFGGRYLIPTFAILSIFISYALTKLRSNAVFLISLLILSGFSISINTLGAITSNRNPPKIEALQLELLSGKQEHYTWERNLGLINENRSKSFVYNAFANKYLGAWDYLFLISTSIFIYISILTIYLSMQTKGRK